MLSLACVFFSFGCFEPVDVGTRMKEYRDNQEMRRLLVQADESKCLELLGTFTCNKIFGMDGLPIIDNWSCTLTPKNDEIRKIKSEHKHE